MIFHGSLTILQGKILNFNDVIIPNPVIFSSIISLRKENCLPQKSNFKINHVKSENFREIFVTSKRNQIDDIFAMLRQGKYESWWSTEQTKNFISLLSQLCSLYKGQLEIISKKLYKK